MPLKIPPLTPVQIQPTSAEPFSTFVKNTPSAITPLRGTELIALVQNGGSVHSTVGVVVPPVRIILAANTAVSVIVTGSDSNLFPGPYATLQGAINVIEGSVDFAGFNLRLTIGPGIFKGAVLAGQSGGGKFQIDGSGSGSTTLINQDGTNATDPFDITGQCPCNVGINKMKIVPVAGSFDCVGTFACGNTLVLGDSIVGGNTDLIFVPVDGINMIFNDFQSIISINAGNITLDGSALSGGGFIGIEPFGGAYIEDFATWTFTHTPAFGGGTFGFISAAANGIYQTFGATYTGAFTGNFAVAISESTLAIASIPVGATIVVDNSSSISAGDFSSQLGNESIAGAPANGTNISAGTHGVFKDRNQATATKGLALFGDDSGTVFPMTTLRTVFADLPASPKQGDMASINDGKAANCGDASCTTFGTTVTGGGGALNLLIWYNGTNWTLLGK